MNLSDKSEVVEQSEPEFTDHPDSGNLRFGSKLYPEILCKLKMERVLFLLNILLHQQNVFSILMK